MKPSLWTLSYKERAKTKEKAIREVKSVEEQYLKTEQRMMNLRKIPKSGMSVR